MLIKTSQPGERREVHPDTRRKRVADEPGPAQRRLAALVGRWRTERQTRETRPAVTIDAVDTYEWLRGRLALLHTVGAPGGERARRGR
jgi:hypothetical protein